MLTVSLRPSAFIRKKAALCLLCLFRKYPDVLPLVDWSSKVVNALNDKNMVRLVRKVGCILLT